MFVLAGLPTRTYFKYFSMEYFACLFVYFVWFLFAPFPLVSSHYINNSPPFGAKMCSDICPRESCSEKRSSRKEYTPVLAAEYSVTWRNTIT